MVFSNSAPTDCQGLMLAQKLSLALLSAGLWVSAYSEEIQPVYQPMTFGGFSEFGMLQSGLFGDNQPLKFHDEWVDHFGVYITQTVLVNHDVAFDIGLGGVFEYQKGEEVKSVWGGTQYKNFFNGPSVADIRYAGSARDGQGFGLQFGMFPYKENPDASNLGEYLFRSGAYPNYITSGGLWFINNSSTQLQGLKAGYGQDGWTGNLFLITETSMPALYDISGAAVISYKSKNEILDLSIGANFKHMIPMKPSHTSPKRATNAYFKKDGVTYSGNDAFYLERSNYYKSRIADDPANSAQYQAKASADSAISKNVVDWIANPYESGIDLKYYTQQGLIVTARISLDIKKLFKYEAFGPNDMRLFAEAAILGVQNYPIYYEKVTERMPIMAGLNLPGFNFIDLVSLQIEYFNSPFLNSYSELVNTNSAIPTQVGSGDRDRSESDYSDITKHDNISWSLLAKKAIAGGVFVSAQVARDHIRTVSRETWTAPEPTEILGKSKDWYWMLQFSYGI
jgi:hypothetical protein